MAEVTCIGVGPGFKEGMTIEAYEAIRASDVIAGYTTYIELLPDDLKDKPLMSTGMRREEERCRKALETAASGQNVAFICSGDASLYGMAGLLYELLPDYPGASVRTVPGVTAALSGSARLGAAIGEDFATISLSNYLVSDAMIQYRLSSIAVCDMCMVLYNPRSNARPDSLADACDVLEEHLPKGLDTVCGAVKNIGREGEHMDVMTLKELRDYDADMFTAVFIGNSKTFIQDGKMITPRGYSHG